MTARTGNQPAKRHSGNVLSIFRKEPAGTTTTPKLPDP